MNAHNNSKPSRILYFPAEKHQFTRNQALSESTKCGLQTRSLRILIFGNAITRTNLLRNY